MAKLKFPVEAGVLIRGAILASIRAEAKFRNLELWWSEDRGWFSSTYIFIAEGENEDILKFKSWLMARAELENAAIKTTEHEE